MRNEDRSTRSRRKWKAPSLIEEPEAEDQELWCVATSPYIPPALRAYTNRLGAEMRNFRRYVIKQEGRDHYHYDAVIISIADDGTVSLRTGRKGEVQDLEALEPSKEEQLAIKEQVAAAIAERKWVQPLQSGGVRDFQLNDLRKMLREYRNCEPTLFAFRNVNGEILFVQERIYGKDDNKHDLPWSYWSDGRWRMMEPGGDLPLYGLDRLKTAVIVYLHEGAKTAQQVQEMVDAYVKGKTELADICPWISRLRDGVHLGWPGGAPNPHRVDWSPIRRLPPHVPVIVVCDNDTSGEQAAPKISRFLQRPMQRIAFGDEFPLHFDLADKFPDALWKPGKDGVQVYKGPSLDDCRYPATWATTADDPPQLRIEFVNQWYHSIRPAAYMLRDQLYQRWSPEEFNDLISPFSDVKDVASLLRKYTAVQAHSLVYEPGLAPGRIAFKRQKVINIYQPSPIRPQKGDAALWLEFMQHLVPNETDRDHLLQWCATLIARPDVRITYSILLISEKQGVGKTTLAEKILLPLIGVGNCSLPSIPAIENRFAYWRAFKRMAIVAELYAGHSSKMYNNLKEAVTDFTVDVEEKYDRPYTITNWLHIVASSNEFRALKFAEGDRRWFVPGITETKREHSYWRKLNDWLVNGGLEIIAWWTQDYVKKHGHVETGLEAPMSEAKRRAIKAAMSEGEQMIVELGERLTERKQQTVIRLDAIRNWLADQKSKSPEFGPDGKRYLEKPETIAARLRGCGLYVFDKRLFEGKDRFQVVANWEIPSTATWTDLKPMDKTPTELMSEDWM
jgi:Family of unknown function (DUF5906)